MGLLFITQTSRHGANSFKEMATYCDLRSTTFSTSASSFTHEYKSVQQCFVFFKQIVISEAQNQRLISTQKKTFINIKSTIHNISSGF